MSVLKHLKMLQHVSIIIQIIFRELVGSLLTFGVCAWRSVWRGMLPNIEAFLLKIAGVGFIALFPVS
jgi:hypothetical protein